MRGGGTVTSAGNAPPRAAVPAGHKDRFCCALSGGNGKFPGIGCAVVEEIQRLRWQIAADWPLPADALLFLVAYAHVYALTAEVRIWRHGVREP